MHVLIIGAGVAGPALALFLAKAGISSAVYEAYPHTAGAGGGLNLAPNGMNVLAAIGLADTVKAGGTLALENCFRSERGRILARYGNGGTKYGQPAVSLRRADLREALVAEMRRQGLAISYEKRLTGVSDSNTHARVVAHFADGISTEGDLLVGADGIHSRVRTAVWPDSPAPAYVGIVGTGGFVPASRLKELTARDRQSLNFTFGTRGFFGYGGARPGEVMWWSNLWRDQEPTDAGLKKLSAEAVTAELLSTYRGYHPPIETLLAHTGPPVTLSIYDIRTLPEWHAGRVILVGDAAHAVSPNAGQGASMALEDAMCLARLLRSARRLEDAFAAFERERRPRVERIVAEGRRRAADKRSATPLQSALRNVVLSMVLNVFGERSYDWIYRYRVDW